MCVCVVILRLYWNGTFDWICPTFGYNSNELLRVKTVKMRAFHFNLDEYCCLSVKRGSKLDIVGRKEVEILRYGHLGPYNRALRTYSQLYHRSEDW
jgi:hypothetical protein